MGDGEFTARVELYSEITNSQKVKLLSFSNLPTTFQVIKDKIEESCSIPACVQRIYYQDIEIFDDCSPVSLYIRSGDTLRISYPIEGETNEIKMFVNELNLISKRVTEELHKIQIDNNYSSIAIDQFFSCTNVDILGRTLFSPWLDPAAKCVNRMHFASLHGIEILSLLYRKVIALRRCASTFCIHKLEYLCVEACTDMAVGTMYARHFFLSGELENCLDTLMIKVADDEFLDYNKIREITLGSSLRIAEIPDAHLELACRTDVIRQRLLVSNSAFHPSNTHLNVMRLLVCISRSRETHQNLLNPPLVDDVIKFCKKNSDVHPSMETSNKVLRTYAGIAFAQMISGSLHLLQTFPLSTLKEMKMLMSQTSSLNPRKIQKYEELRDNFAWQSFQDCLQYLYTPILTDTTKLWKNYAIIEELYFLSLDMLLYYLQYALGRPVHVDVIANEKMLDFVVALPWTVPSCFEKRAKHVVRELAKIKVLQVPTLSSLAKAKLATFKWGLKRLLNVTCINELM